MYKSILIIITHINKTILLQTIYIKKNISKGVPPISGAYDHTYYKIEDFYSDD